MNGESPSRSGFSGGLEESFYLRYKRKSPAIAWISVIVFALVTYVIFSAAVPEEADQVAGRILGNIWFIVIVVVGLAVRSSTRRWLNASTPAAKALLASDPRAPVLYLRAFGADGDTLGDHQQVETHTGNFMGLAIQALRIPRTFEENLALEVDTVGPFIALSRPHASDEEDVAGASRLDPMGDAEWQDRVTELLKTSKLIVLRTGPGNGLYWEIARIKELGLLDRLVLFIEFFGDEAADIAEVRYRKFKQVFIAKANVDLPDFDRRRKFVHFQRDGQPLAAKRLKDILLAKKIPVERSALRARGKAGLPGASNLHRKIFTPLKMHGLFARNALLLALGVLIGILCGFVKYLIATSLYYDDVTLSVADMISTLAFSVASGIFIGRAAVWTWISNAAIVQMSVWLGFVFCLMSEFLLIGLLVAEVDLSEIPDFYRAFGGTLLWDELFFLGLPWLLCAYLAWVYSPSDAEKRVLQSWQIDNLKLPRLPMTT